MSLNYRKSPFVCSYVLSISADPKNAVICIVVVFLLIFRFSSPFSEHLGTVPSVLNIISIAHMPQLFQAVSRIQS